MDGKEQHDSEDRFEEELQAEMGQEPADNFSDQDSTSSGDFSTADDSGEVAIENISEKPESEIPSSGAEPTEIDEQPHDFAQNEHKQESGDIDQQDEKKISTPTISRAKIVLTVVLVLALFSGFFIFENKSATRMMQKEQSRAPDEKAKRFRKTQEMMGQIQTEEPASRYHAKINEMKALRETLLRKQEEIVELKEHYRKGIEELENEVSDELQKEQFSTFLEAMKNKRIEFALRTIQRRQTYIQQLGRPYDWVSKACEELLYIQRRATMDLQVAEVASGIDLEKHLRVMNESLSKYQPTADKLALDMTEAQPETLFSIWERIEDKRLQHSSAGLHSNNRIIFEQICTGNFERVGELTEISAKAAECLTEMQAADLFLNGLSEISPAVARHLYQWNGSWICLNGLRALSPRVARYLFQWNGDWISLNGLTAFPAEIGALLLQWEGHQLELMGLEADSDLSGEWITYLARWEQAGGRLFVPIDIRQKIDQLNRETS